MALKNKSQRFERLVVGTIRKLRDIQGSTFKEICDYLSQEYNVPSSTIKKQVRLALCRGVSYEILHRNNRNTYVCNNEFYNRQYQPSKNGEVMEPCPWLKQRFRRKKIEKKHKKPRRKQKIRKKKLSLSKRKKRRKKKNKRKRMREINKRR